MKSVILVAGWVCSVCCLSACGGPSPAEAGFGRAGGPDGVAAAGTDAAPAPAPPEPTPFAQLPSLAEQKPNTWVKRSPINGSPVSPRKGYESSMDYDPHIKRLIRHGGHNQGGGGAQYFEVWLLDPLTMQWELRQPNTSPPGFCCVRDNVFSHVCRRFVRFPAHSLNHGWQWNRMVYLRNWTAWAYDAAGNRWRNMRPLPHVPCRPGRGAAYDTHHDGIVVFSGEGSYDGTAVYDLYTNTWHRMDPPNSPPPRCYTGFAYDRGRRKVVMFGSHYGNDARTWLYDIRANTWTDTGPPSHPPANHTAPVMAYDSLNQVMLAVLRTDAKDSRLQTWVYDPAGNTWKRMEPAGDLGESGSRNRLLVYLPDHNIFVLENRTSGQQQVWTYRYAPVDRSKLPPSRPENLTVTVSADGTASLNWQSGPGAAPAGYRLYRGSGQTPWKADFKRVGPDLVKATRFSDAGLAKGVVHYYCVSAVDNQGREGDQSLPARTQPRALDHAVVSVLDAREVEVSWGPAAGKDVVGYHVERADVEVYTTAQHSRMAKQDGADSDSPPVGLVRKIGSFKRLNEKPIRAAEYLDRNVDLARKDHKVHGKASYAYELRSGRYNAAGKPYRFAVYAYRIRAVNSLGTVSGPSPFFLTIPAPVEGVFAKEEGLKTRLKWRASPGKKLRGYIVYRMNNRHDGRFPRLTPAPIAGTTFTDEKAGSGKSNSHRYFIVAADALGQEGVPSSPVWSYREWVRYYKLFGAGLGTWHQ